ncbi:winged helix-turn-helix domain-containing protein [Pelagibius marinus]|uniref:winged helix-turn-helix domain-containing protein n=1 Tax=Pelagibius marinus TaxID=2762760 RepID=UPI001872A327|nr:response regulator transcription factor [Pelagibius marinus]
MRILVIEDDKKTADYILKGLAECGYTTDWVDDGRDGLHQATSGKYDAIIVDRMLPGLDGLAIVKALRAAELPVPVLILSALAHVDERVTGLRAGGDDYLSKPFAFSELQARLEALLRRPHNIAQQTELQVDDLKMDLLTRKVSRAGRPIDLRPQEFKLLEYLMRHAGKVVTRTMLFEGVWDFHFDPQTNVVDVHISRLRQKVDKGFDKPLIHTHRGGGYCISADG